MSKKVDFLIIGGSAAGTTAAETIRSLSDSSTIVIITDEGHEQYSRVLLPHYIRGKVQREQVFLKNPEWYKSKSIELIRRSKVVKLDPNVKKITLSNNEEIEYGKVLITVGGYVVPFNAPGIEKANILYLRTIEDADRVISQSKAAKNAVIIGGGFIGLEFASCFLANGVKDITFLVKEPYFWSNKLDEDSAKIIVSVLGKNGIKVMTNEEVERFEEGKIVTKSGKSIAVDVVGVGIGIKSDFSFLTGSGININRAIVTSVYLETNVADVYAAGDCAEFHDVIFNRQHIMGNWSNATSQGAAVGKTMAGVKTIFETASSYTINFFDGACSFIGVTDRDFADQVVVRGSANAGKVTRIFIKKIDDKTRIVGATVVNSAMDVAPLTMAIKSKIDVGVHITDLGHVEFDLKNLISSS